VGELDGFEASYAAAYRHIAVVHAVYGDGGTVRAHRLVYVDPTTGATTPGAVLAKVAGASVGGEW
jgi:hypothetical protein